MSVITAQPPAPAFTPVPVESPGGGRIRDKRDPARADLVTVQGRSRPLQVHRLAAQAWAAMVAAARADGIAAPLLLPVSGYRSTTKQAALWQQAVTRYGPQEAHRWVAPPGSSAHQSGRALDLYVGSPISSRYVDAMRRQPAWHWLHVNAERFGFYPYEAEPWHWEYNPRAAGELEADTAPVPGSLAGRTPVRAGRIDAPSVPVLASHRGRGAAAVLRWNDMAAAPAELDVVVHLHGFSHPWLDLGRDIVPISGLDLVPVGGGAGAGRTRPTLTVLPRGHYTGVQQRGGPRYVYTFPALDGTDGRRDGVPRLVRFALDRFSAATGTSTPRIGRLILTAHSGGGLPLLRMLAFLDPAEVHVFDALYWDSAPLAGWALRHLQRDRANPAAAAPASARQYMATAGGALRVFHGPGTRAQSRRLRHALGTDPRLADWYRVEATTYPHMDIPRSYGWRLLADASADVPNAVREGAAATAPAPAPSPAAAPPAGGTPAAAQFTGRVPSAQRWRLLVPLLDRYRADIPLDFLLGWVAVESGARVDDRTSLDERGFFQIHPDESRDRHFDHLRLSSDPDYSVRAGIENVRYYAALARRRFPSVPAGSELFWRIVKLQHAMGSGLAKQLLDGLSATGVPLTWEAIERYEITDGPRLHRLLRVRPLGRFGHNVDEVFTRGRKLAHDLGR